MGKASRVQRRAGLRRALGRFDSTDLWPLVVAAGASPSARHRWVRVGYIASQAAAFHHRGGRRVSRHLLSRWLDEAAAEMGGVDHLEDYLPEDPRDVVRVRVAGRVYRLGPGEVERPVADVDRALLVAEAVDPMLVDRLGFGVLDLVEVMLGYQDAAFEVLAGSWPSGATDLAAPVAISQEEVEAARSLVALGTPASLLPTSRHERALDWLTCDPSELHYDPAHPQSSSRQFVRITSAVGEDPRWLPLFFFPGALGYAVTKLASEVARVPEARLRFAEVVAREARRYLWRFDTVMGPPDVDGKPRVTPRNAVQWISQRTDRRSLLVQVASALSLETLNLHEEPEALRAVRALDVVDGEHPATVRMAMGQATLRPGAEAVPLLVIGTPAHVAAPHRPGLPGLSLDDLRWISATATSSSDLYNYCRDMARIDLPAYMGWEAIDTWEWWRANANSFFRGGLAPSMISIAPHSGTAEWRRAASLSPLEDALARLGLPPLRELETDPLDDGVGPQNVVAFENESPCASEARGRHDRPTMSAWAVHVGPLPVAVSALRPTWEDDQVKFLADLAMGLAYAFEGVAHDWAAVHQDAGVSGYRVNLSSGTGGGGLLTVRKISRVLSDFHPDRDIVTVELLVDTQPLHSDDDTPDITAAFHAAIATAIATCAAPAVGEESAARLKAAIGERPPTFAAQVSRPMTARNDLRLPLDLDEALVSVVDRRVAEAVRTAGVKPGEYSGTEAKNLDRDVLAPAALGLLTAALLLHSMDEVVLFGMEQLERCMARKEAAQADIQQSAQKLSVTWDPVARYQELEHELVTLRRCIEAALEVALRTSPEGALPIDDVSWGEILAAARGYLDATTRSEAIHNQVNPTVLRVSESFEVSTRSDESGKAGAVTPDGGILYDFDGAAFHRVRAAGMLAGERPVDLDDVEHPGAVSKAVDIALLEAFGAAGSDLFATLTSLASWPLEPTDPDALAVSPAAAIEHTLACWDSSEPEAKRRERIGAAMQMLTSTSVDLQSADWKPWQARSRKRRILIQPFAQLTDGRIVVAPRLCMATASIYLRYLTQGQLPWSQPSAPRVVSEALETVRERRNKKFELRIGSILREAGWSVVSNVKETKPERLNLPVLRTEVDVVAGRAGDRNIWLLEVKDPAEAFALADIRRSLDRFFLDQDKKPSYVTQLRKKVEDLTPYATNVAEALGLPLEDLAAPYVIRPMFVTRHPVAAEFVTSPFPFTSEARLLGRLSEGDIGGSA